MVKECRQPVLEEEQADGFIRQLYEVEDNPNLGEYKYKRISTGKILTHEEYMEKQGEPECLKQ